MMRTDSSLNADQTAADPMIANEQTLDLDALFFPPPRSTQYQTITLIVSGLISVLCVPFFIEGNKNAPEYALASSVATNVLIGFYVVKEAIDLFDQLIKEKKYAQAAGIATVAAALYIPQILITIMESTYSRGLTSFFATATGLSGIFLSAYGVASLPELVRSLKNKMTQEWPYTIRNFLQNHSNEALEQHQIKSHILDNLNTLLICVEATSNYRGVRTLQFHSIAELLDRSIQLAKDANDPCLKNTDNVFLTPLKFLFQIVLSLSIAYPFFSYVCATDKSVRNNFHFSPNLSATTAIFLMSYCFIMAIRGALNLADNACRVFSMWNHGRILSNSMRIGFGVAVPFAAAFIASFSGKPTREFASCCETSRLKSWVTFPYYRDVMDYAATVFNTIYTGMALMWFSRYLVKGCGGAWNNDFFVLVNALQQLIHLVHRTPENAIPPLFDQLRDYRKSGLSPDALIMQENFADDPLDALKSRPIEFFSQYVKPDLSQPTERSALLQAW